MANNVIIPTTGSGDATPTVAALQIGTPKFQQVIVGDVALVAATPTVTSGLAYAAGQTVGGALTFTGAARLASGPQMGGIIQNCFVLDKSLQKALLELWLFNQTFTSSGDKTTWNPSTADLLNCIGVIPVNQYFSTSTEALGQAANLNFGYQCAADANLYGQLVTRGTPTYTSTTALVVGMSLLRE